MPSSTTSVGRLLKLRGCLGEWPALPLGSPQCIFAANRSFQPPTAEPGERSYGVRPVNAGKACASTRHWWEPYAVGLRGAG